MDWWFKNRGLETLPSVVKHDVKTFLNDPNEERTSREVAAKLLDVVDPPKDLFYNHNFKFNMANTPYLRGRLDDIPSGKG